MAEAQLKALSPDELARVYVENVDIARTWGDEEAERNAQEAERIGKGLQDWAELVRRAAVSFYYE